jgi:hypothetical protein
MDQFIYDQEFMEELFDDAEIAGRSGEIGMAILEARSLRLKDIVVEMEGGKCCGV